MFRYLVLCLALASCIPSNKDRKAEQPRNTDSLTAQHDSSIIPPSPSTEELKARLFDFFARHIDEPTFDTVDETMWEYWRVPRACVKGGHLFSHSQTHALLYYATDTMAAMHVFIKKPNGWQQIYEDMDTLWHRLGGVPEFKDWNGDGTKDIWIDHTHMTDRYSTCALWLVDKNGSSVHYVEDFVQVPNPQLGHRLGDIYSNYYHLGLHKKLFQFTGVKIKESLSLYMEHLVENPLDTCSIRYYHNGNEEGMITTATNKVYQSRPKAYRELYLIEDDTSWYRD